MTAPHKATMNLHHRKQDKHKKDLRKNHRLGEVIFSSPDLCSDVDLCDQSLSSVSFVPLILFLCFFNLFPFIHHGPLKYIHTTVPLKFPIKVYPISYT